MQFVMHEVLNVVDEFKQIPKHADIDADTINAVLEEGGKFAAEVTFPLNISGDQEGCKIDQTTHAVTTPKGFKHAYDMFREGGWTAVTCDPEYGGQGLPATVGFALQEEMLFDDKGLQRNPNLTNYIMPTSLDMPEIEVDIVKNFAPTGPFGAKGVGEPTAVPTAAAIMNAIYDAVGARVKSLPATPEKVLAAIKAARAKKLPAAKAKAKVKALAKPKAKAAQKRVAAR